MKWRANKWRSTLDKGEKERSQQKRKWGKPTREKGEKKKSDRERERNKKGDFPSVPTVGTRQSEKKSRSTHNELRVSTKILEFRQALRGREFSYLEYF